jgi:serine-type D-Ala-D-Ala endopeptidase (penicillin-binding protein 7)
MRRSRPLAALPLLLLLACSSAAPPESLPVDAPCEAADAEVQAAPDVTEVEREPTPVHPDHLPDDGPWIRSYGAYVQDRATGEVLVSKKADRPRPMASIAKLMGALTWLEADPDLDEVIRISRDDAYTPSFTRSPLRIGSSYRSGDLLKMALLESDNRAMAALARASGLDAAAFAEAMNTRAADLGMVRAAFDEPTGISGDNRCTPFEAGVLLQACLEDARLAEILGQEQIPFRRVDRDRRMVAQSTNMLTRMDHWRVLGSKTGYTCLAGSCLVMIAQVEGRELLMSFMGHPELEMRFNDAGEIRWWLHEGGGT